MKILSEPFEQCHASFEHISFEEHIKTLVELSNSLKEFTMMPTQYKDLIFRFDYIIKLMIPICSYLCLYSEHLSFALLKYSYMMMLSLTNHNHNNFISHLLEINGIYHEYGKVSVTMQHNHTKCTMFLKNYAEENKIRLDENSRWVEKGIGYNLDLVITPTAYVTVSKEAEILQHKFDTNSAFENELCRLISLRNTLTKFK